jgi:hypothetical protein
MTYTQLKTEIANYLHRTDLTAQIPMFITLAESFLFRELNIKELQISATGTTTGGYGTLPVDFGSVSRVSITYSGAARTLDYVSLADAPTSVNAQPGKYSLEKNKLRIWGAADGQTYTLYYTPLIAALSASVTTNWILENAFDLYLYAASLEGAKYVRNEAEIAKLGAAIPGLLDGVKRYSERRGQPATGSMQIRARN